MVWDGDEELETSEVTTTELESSDLLGVLKAIILFIVTERVVQSNLGLLRSIRLR